jgi:hypothetical protein
MLATDSAMTTQLRRATPPSLSLGLSIGLCVGLWAWATPAVAAPPDDEADVDVAEAEAEAVAEADEAEANEPEADEPEADEPEAEVIQADEADPGEQPAAGKPTKQPLGSEARHPKKKIQIPVDIGDKHSFTYTNMLTARHNPLGLENRLWIGYQYRLYNKNKTILNGSNIGIFLRPFVSPAVTLLGATVQVQPAAVLRLRATYSWMSWFGSFQFFQSFQSPYDDYSETRLRTMADAGQNYKTTGQQVELEALIQARYKGLVLRSATVANYNVMGMRGDDDLFYDIRIDMLVANRGWVLYNDTDLMWIHDFKGDRHASLMAGARASVVMPFYPDSVYEPGDELSNPNGPLLRIGPSIGYVFYDRPDRNPRFNRPTLLLMPQWNVLHRWRAGRDHQTVMPTIALAFVFTGQLWGKN